MKITGLLLAAGKSSRMSRGNKLTLPFRSSTIIEESLNVLMSSTLDQVIVIVGYEADTVSSLVNRHRSPRLKIVMNPDYEAGRGSSIRQGSLSLDPACDAALFMVADKPAVSVDLIERAVKEFETYHPLILCVRTPEGRGHPVIFGRAMFDELQALLSDEVEQKLFEQHATQIHWLQDDRPQINVNTAEDYDKLLSMECSSSNTRISAGKYDRE